MSQALGLAVMALAGTGGGCRSAGTYENPIIGSEAGADPAAIIVDGTYYNYATNDGSVYVSQDLVNWTKGPKVIPDDLKGMWAPEVYRHPEDGKFYMYYTYRYRIGVAVADRPDGMFKDLGLLTKLAIDAHLFRDDDGRLYLYFTNTPTFTMYCIPMKSPTETGGPVTKCFEVSADWEKHEQGINEGPWMLKHNGTYYLLYSGSSGQTVHYAVGYATAPTPLGPFTKHPGNPVFAQPGKIFGPGHGSVVRDRNGALWHLYHQKVDDTHGWKRDTCLDPVGFDKDGVFGGTPTRGIAQSAPACDPDLVWSPDIAPRGGVLLAPAKVTIISLTPGAEIRYTLDDTEPTEASALYRQPLVLNQAGTVKARAFKAGMRPSAVASMTFQLGLSGFVDRGAPNAPAGVSPLEIYNPPLTDWKKLLPAKK